MQRASGPMGDHVVVLLDHGRAPSQQAERGD
jgi:hypothetical protein